MEYHATPPVFAPRALWNRIGFAVIISLIFAGLTAIVTYPVITQLNQSLAQNPAWGTDAFHHTYVLWWFKKALLGLHISPADLRLIQFPSGGYYPLLLTYSAVYLVGLPLLLFFSPVATYNLLFLLTFFFSGLSAYALCAHLTQNRWAGLFGGIVYAFFPGRVAHAFSGHLELISTYWFPLYLLLLIKSVERPRLPTSLLCGLTLAASMLVQPMYIVFLLAPITLVWLLYEKLALHREIECRTVMALAGAFVPAVLLATPFFWPALREQVQGQGQYLQGGGIANYSADLLGIVSPSPLNPILNTLKAVPSYASRAVPVNDRLAELLIYAGIIPLALSALAILVHRRKMGAWAWVALGAALLSLGPLLKVNGKLVSFSADPVTSFVSMPYALFMNLPMISYSRAPARINVTLMLMVAVMSAYGVAWIVTRLQSGWGKVVAVALCLVTLSEFLVIWPCPTTRVQLSADLSKLAHSDERKAVLNLPITWNTQEIALFYQTLHEQPVFGSWVQRSLRTPNQAARFLEGLFQPPPDRDIIPLPSTNARVATARAQEMGYVLLFNHYASDESRQFLSETFGQPQSANPEIAFYQVPSGPSTVDELVYAFPTEGLGGVETWKGQPARWLLDSADLYLYSPSEQAGVLRFAALPFSTQQRLQVEVNGRLLAPLLIGDWMTYTTPLFNLRPGLNQIVFHSLDGCTNMIRDPRCTGPALSGSAECDPSLYWERCISILFQNIRFAARTTGPAEHAVETVLGDRIQFLGYDLDGVFAPSQRVSITLYWQALKPIYQDYHIFVHLLGSDGQLLAQQDGLPMHGLYPTFQWLSDDVFTHKATIEIPASAPAGQYDLLTGLYTYPDLKRLPVASDRPHAQDGLIWLQSVSITP